MTQDELQTALWHAAKSGNKEHIRKLVVAGADVLMLNGEGQNALHIASQNGRADAYKTLQAAAQMQSIMMAGVQHTARKAA